ncbi:MAG: PadR family transcriptional regulator [Desulfurococcales archaeon]|nr:PadR family transcriptional regulator [Desulfurococcales archaeon]
MTSRVQALRKASSTYRETLRNLVLRILLDGPMHGYEIMRRIKEITRNRWKPAAGTLYPLLEQLREEGLITVAGVEVSNVRGGKRIMYKLTRKGVEEAARIIKEKAQTKFDILIFYIVEGVVALKRHGLEDEYREICEAIREGYSKLGVVLEDRCGL